MPSEDAKGAGAAAASAAQRARDEDEDGMSLGSILKDRKNKALNAAPASSSKPRPKAGGSNDGSDKRKGPLKPGSAPASGPGSRGVKVKKEEKVEEDDDDDDKPISRRLGGVKKEEKVEEDDDDDDKPITRKLASVKVDKRDPLRIFYESLYKQIPRSEMAQFWMMESGLLPKDEAKKVFDKKQRKSQAQKLSSPAKSAVSVQRSSQTVSIKKKDLSFSVSSKKKTTDVKVLSKQSKKRKDEDTSCGEDSDDDFVISRTKKQRTAN
ncbi:hypothetical protein BT93_F0262 [Corymbia citriodora subsp. variegata]|nr:hypothetical protein BT93_F0262 [Corymbia citriodora subsp. variegata]